MNESNDNGCITQIIISVIATIVGGVILAYIIQDARFDPRQDNPILTEASTPITVPTTRPTTVPATSNISSTTELSNLITKSKLENHLSENAVYILNGQEFSGFYELSEAETTEAITGIMELLNVNSNPGDLLISSYASGRISMYGILGNRKSACPSSEIGILTEVFDSIEHADDQYILYREIITSESNDLSGFADLHNVGDKALIQHGYSDIFIISYFLRNNVIVFMLIDVCGESEKAEQVEEDIVSISQALDVNLIRLLRQ